MKFMFVVVLGTLLWTGCAHHKSARAIPAPPPPPAVSNPSEAPPAATAGNIPPGAAPGAAAPRPGETAPTGVGAPLSAETGLASWYGHPYHGRAAADGEIYDMEKMTAAHRTLPFDTVVRVVNLDNQKTVQVRITDRGPFVDGRIIDLSHAAARAIDMIGPGTAQVRMEVLSLPAGPAGFFAVQIGAFRDKRNADRARASMEARYGSARLVRREDTPTLWRVVVGKERTEDGAAALKTRIRRESGEKNAFVVRLDS